MSKTLIIIITIAAVLASTIYLLINGQNPQEFATAMIDTGKKATSAQQGENFRTRTAAFLIYTNGTERTFSDSMYHNQSTDVYIEAVNPEIIQVKAPYITWGDFFNTLPFTLTSTCLTTGLGETFCNDENSTLTFYLNGTITPNALERTIIDGDRLLVSYGAYDVTRLVDEFHNIDNP